jgi:hypothetical protein
VGCVGGLCWRVILHFLAKTIEADGIEDDFGKGSDLLMYWCKTVRSTLNLCQEGPSLSMPWTIAMSALHI